MKWLFILLIPCISYAQALKPGTYRNLKPTHPLVLDTGNFIFIGLEMKNLGKGIWLDARKARSLTLSHCRFEGTGSGTAVATNNHASITNCIFKKLEKGIWATLSPKPSKKKPQSRTGNTFTGLDYGIMVPTGSSGATPYSITGNIFDGNKNGVYLGSGQFKLELKCNVFSQTTPIPSGNTHVGLLIGENASLFQNRIGGNETSTMPESPNSNYFPRSGTGLNAGPVDGYVSIKNESPAQITYWQYHNELVRNVIPDFTSGLSNYLKLDVLTGLTYSVNDVTISNWCSSNYNSLSCGYSTIGVCEADLLNNLACTNGATWVKACTGGPIDNVSWPVARMSVDPGSNSVTTIIPSNQILESSLGQSIPNPGRDRIVIPYFLAENTGKASLQIVEMATGKVVAIVTDLASGEGRLDVDVSRFSAGVFGYLLLTEKGKSPKAMNFVIIH